MILITYYQATKCTKILSSKECAQQWNVHIA